MGQSITVPDLTEDMLATLNTRAAHNGRSVELEARAILDAVLSRREPLTFEALAAEVRRLTAGRPHTPSEVILSDARAER